MFDLNSVKKRSFAVYFGETTLHIEPPKVKLYKEIVQYAYAEVPQNLVYDNVTAALQLALSANREGQEITEKMIEEVYDTDESRLLLRKYMDWIKSEESSPN